VEGMAPNPYYDPLEFAIDEAHKRNIELHAWFNPYRAKKGSHSGVTAGHVFNKHPEWVLTISKKGGQEAWQRPMDERTLELTKDSDYILNPGMADVRSYVLGVIMDVVNRYDIDGVHMDDYFYPYSGISNEDKATFSAESRGFSNLHDWRRDNVNLLIESIYDSIKTVKPHVKLGMSPFGIWKCGVPTGIVGFDAYNVIYCDGVAWLKGQYVDYLTPQLYWEFGGGQDYGKLMPWWASRAANNSRHLYPGHAAYKAASWKSNELPRQITLNRRTEACLGSVYFSYRSLDSDPCGLLDSLEFDYYCHPALSPPMHWLDSLPPAQPASIRVDTVGNEALITWQSGQPAKSEDAPYRHILYKWPTDTEPDTDNPAFIEAITTPAGPDSVYDRNYDGYYYGVAALDRLNNESPVTLSDAVAIREERNHQLTGYRLDPNFPNPFNPVTEIRYTLPAVTEVNLQIFDLGGKLIETLVRENQAAGSYAVRWDGTNFASGVYIYRLAAGNFHRAGKMVLLK